MHKSLESGVNFPVDLVYLWVDGSDPVWSANKQKYLAATNSDAIENRGAVNERWQDNDELRHSLRSVEMFAPWINHIFIVTDDQHPKWLKTKHPDVTVVSHREIFPEGILPIFNSDAIETRLPFIPGLSEHFLYSNDDMFFGRETRADFFFSQEGKPILRVKPIKGLGKYQLQDGFTKFTEPLKTQGNLYRVCRMVKVIYEATGMILPYQDAHVIDPMRKSNLLSNLQDSRFKSLWEATMHSRFRSPEIAQRILHTFIDNSEKRNRIKNITHFKALRRMIAPQRMPMLLCKPEDFAKIRKIRPHLFCIFDNLDNRHLFPAFFADYFPEKSSFEI